ncbi:hypothetical protein CHU33_23865 [Superficieibacter electus]|uniref:BapA prefix-like domain-containing protein n=1 Tax=Superficieibacter electus TaxID=2022662 RepID=A0ABX4Z781_9ENTR|nr:BapA/Bap/LapF family large adhesin [Superficieibacter electus]POP41210.1 hypothetical protein CHU33_23865 [Superficieibacter electus]
MVSISVISALTGVETSTTASEVTLSHPAIVKLQVARADIASLARNNNDLIVHLHSGETIAIKNFYLAEGDTKSLLVLEDGQGALWWVEDPAAAGLNFVQIGSIDDLLVTAGAGAAASDGAAPVWPWVLGGLLGGGGLAAVAASSGGSGSDDDNSQNTTPPPGSETGTGEDNTPPGAPENLVISDDGKTITGSAEPGSTITVTDGNGTIIGTGTTGSDGNFTVDLDTPQTDGKPVEVVATDPSGNTGPSASIDTPDLTAPDAPTSLLINDDGTTLTGRAEAGSTVRVTDASGNLLGTAVTDADGHFQVTLNPAQTHGETLNVSATDAAGNISPSATVVAPDLVTPEDGTLDSVVDDTGAITGELRNGQLTDDTRPTLNGSGEPGTTVTVYDNGTAIGSTQVDASGAWRFTPDTALSEGAHILTVSFGNSGTFSEPFTLVIDITPPPAPTDLLTSEDGTTVTGSAEAGSTVTITDASGNVLGSGTAESNGSFTIGITPAQTNGEPLTAIAQDAAGNTGPSASFSGSASLYPDVPTIVSALDDAGTLTGLLGNGQITDDATPTLSGDGEPGATITLYSDDAIIGTTQVDASGHWSFTPLAALGEGEHRFTATATNASGTSGASTTFTLTVDLTPPAAPNGLTISDDGTALTGNAEAGSTVTVTDGNGQSAGSVVVGADGSFTIPLDPPQTNGQTLNVVATDPAGNSGPVATVTAPVSAPEGTPVIEIALDDAGPIVGSLTSGQRTDDTTPTLSGSGTPDATLTVYDNGVEIGSVTIGSDGRWNFTPDTPLGNGSHALTVTATDAQGNVSPASGAFTLIIDTDAPAVPVFISLTDDAGTVTGPLIDGQVSDDTRPTFTGRGEPGSTITLYDNDSVIGLATVDPAGSWTFTPADALTDGSHRFTITATDAVGNTSAVSAPWTVIIDTTAPDTPAVPAAADASGSLTGPITEGQTTDETRPVLSGSGEPGATVSLYDGTTLLGTTVIADDGGWQFTPVTPLAEGAHALTVTVTDIAGNTSQPSAPLNIVVDTTPPAAPDGLITSEDGTTVTGSAEAGSTVTITDASGNVLGSGTAGDNGSFSIGIVPAQTNGETLTATARDVAGNDGPAATFTGSTSGVPDVPVLVSIVDDVGSITGNLTDGQTTDDTTPTLNGTGEPDATITVYSNGVAIGTTTVDGAGNWRFTPSPALAEGENTFTFTLTATNGNGTSGVSQPLTLIVDTTPPAAPEDLSVSEDGVTLTGSAEANSTVTITDANGNLIGTGVAGPDGTFSATLTPPQVNGEALSATATTQAGNAGPAASVNAPDITAPAAPDDLAVSEDGTTLTGNAEAGSTITVTDGNGQPLGTTTAGPDGSFTLPLTPPLTNGEPLNVVASDPAGNPSPAATINAPDTTPPEIPTLAAVTDDSGPLTGPLTSGQSTDDARPVLNGNSEPGTTITVYDNGTLLGTTQTDNDGSWTFTPPTPLADGSHALTVTATDTANNTSAPGPAFVVNVDTLAPPTPAIETITDSAGTITDTLITTDPRPVLSGSGEAGTTLTVYDNGAPAGSVVVAADGSWRFTPESDLSEGNHTFTLIAQDAAGNTSSASAPIDLEVDLTAPDAPATPVINDNTGIYTGQVDDSQPTDETRPVLTGNGEAGTMIAAWRGTEMLGTAMVDEAGNWSLTPDTPLAHGIHDLRFTATDRAGNVSEPSDTLRINVDLVAPAAPSELNVSLDGTTVTGQAEAGNLVTITDASGNVLGSATADDNGAFSVNIAPAQTNGETLLASARDSAGNRGPEADLTGSTSGYPDVPTILSVSDDVGTIKGNLTNGQHTDDTQPTLSGTGEPESTITVYLNGEAVGSVLADAAGNWSYTPENPLAEGENAFTFTVTATNNNGTSGESQPFTIVVDTLAPDAPVITDVLDDAGNITGTLTRGQTTDDRQPTLSGSSEPGATLTFYDNGAPVGSVQADNSGNWRFTPAQALSEGDHSITVTATDTAGNVSDASPAFDFTVVITAPAAPAITAGADDAGTVTGPLSSGQTTDDAQPQLSGTASAGSQIVIYDNGVQLGVTTANGDGRWTFTPDAALSEGNHDFTATAADTAGNVSDASPVFSLIVDLTAPDAPALPTINDDTGSITGPLAEGQATDDTRPTLSGTGEAGSLITLYDGDTVTGTAIVDDNGQWSFTPQAALSEGEHVLTFTATASAGNVSQPSAPIAFVVDTTPPAAPTGLAISENGVTVTGNAEAGSLVTIVNAGGTVLGSASAGDDGAFTIAISPAQTAGQPLTAVAQDSAGNSGPAASFTATTSGFPAVPAIVSATDAVGALPGTLSNGQTTDDTRPQLAGTAAPGTSLTVYDNGNLLGTALTGANGQWSFTPATVLAEGSHAFTVTATNANGTSAPSTAFALTVDVSAPAAPIIGEILDDAGSLTGPITAGQPVDDPQPRVTGSGEPGTTVTLYDNGTAIGSATVNPDGSWSLTPDAPLADGEHSLTVVATDPAGNVGPASPAVTLTVDTLAPDVPAITAIIDNQGPVTGPLSEAQATDATLPVINGTGEPGATISIVDNGTPAGTAQVNEQGNWTFTPASPLSEGPHAITVIASDAAGNASAPSAAFTFTVDLTAPAVPALPTLTDDTGPLTGVIVNGARTDDSQPTFTGSGEAGTTITLYDGSVVLGTVPVNEDGSWTFTPTTALAEGSHALTFTATDAVGNASQPSAAIRIVVDTTAPAAPGDLAVSPQGTTVTGTAEAGSLVTITDASGTVVLGSATANPDGTFTVTISPAQTAGESLLAQATDSAGNASPATAFTATDSGFPDVPVIVSVSDDVGPVVGNLSNGQRTDDMQPTLTGTGEPGATVTIYNNGSAIGTALTDGDGNWTFTPADPLPEGENSVTFTVTASNGNGTSDESQPFTLIVDTVAPDAPVIGQIIDDVEGGTGPLTSGQPSNDPQPTLSGTAEPGATITIYDGVTALGTAVTNASGVWSFTPPAPLASGTHPLTVVATDSAGNSSAPSTAFNLQIDPTPPGAPVIVTVTDDIAPGTGPVTSGQPTNDTQPRFSGTAEAGATVTLYSDGVAIGSARVSEAGNWTLTPAQPLSDGTHAITAVATDAAGNSGPLSASFTLVVDISGPDAPILTAIADDTGSVTGAVAAGQTTDDTRPTLSGTAEANTSVEIFDNGTAIGRAAVNADGEWRFTPATALAEGPHSFTLVATDASGNSGPASSPFAITIDTTAPETPLIDSVSDDSGSITGTLTNGQATDDTRPTLSGSGEPGSVIRLYDNGVEIASVQADADGNWSLTPQTPLGSGNHPLTVTATDAAGNSSAPSPVFNVLIDVSAPVAPVIASVIDDVTGDPQPLTSGQLTRDTQPALSGTTEAGATVRIFDNGEQLGVVQADGSGNWQFTPPAALGEGTHNLTVSATDSAGNSGPASTAFTVVIDLTAPEAAAPTITDDTGLITGVLTDGQRTDDTRPALSGSGEPGNRIVLFDNGAELGSTTVGTDGQWQFTPDAPLAEGSHRFTVQETDSVGNVSQPSAAVTVIIDVTPPQAAVINAVTEDGTTVSGTAEAGALITIVNAGNVQIGSGVVDADGNFTVRLSPAQTMSQPLEARIQDSAGNVGEPTPFTGSDSGLPDAPAILTVTDDAGALTGSLNAGQATDDTRPLLSGTAEANAQIVLYNNGTELGRVQADASGNWSFTPQTALADGPQQFTATATTAAGISGFSAAFAIVVDTLAPDAPADLSVSADGLSVTGSAEAGSRVTIADASGNPLGSGISGENGSFSVTLNAPQTNGQPLTAIATDAAGNASPSSTIRATDSTAPDAPADLAITPDGSVVTGRAEPGSTVNIVNADNENVGSGTADENGDFSIELTTPQITGEPLSATATDAAENTGPAATVTTPDLTPPVAPSGLIVSEEGTSVSGTAEAGSTVTITGPGNAPLGSATADADGQFTVTLTTPQTNGEQLSATATDAADNVGPAATVNAPDITAPQPPAIVSVVDDVTEFTGELTDGQSTNDTRPTLTGTAEASATVRILDNGTEIGSVTADASGNWNFTPDTALSNGGHVLTVTATDGDGNVSQPSAAFSLVVDTEMPQVPAITLVTDDIAPVSGPVASGQSTNDPRPTLSGTGEIGSTVTIFDNGTAIGSAQVSDTGSWSFTPAEALAAGAHRLTVSATDGVGNTSALSTPFTLTVDTTLPDAPVITAVIDDVGSITGPLTSGQRTDDTRPALSGTAEANSTVRIMDNGTLIGTVQAGNNGGWSFTPTAPLANGAHTLTVTATDAAGNVSPAASVNLTVDTLAPAAPTIVTVTDDVGSVTGTLTRGQTTDDTRPQLSGNGEPGATLNLYDNGTLLGSTMVSPAGDWSFTPATALSEGSHALTAVAVDVAGNASPASAAFTIVVDITAPTTPDLTAVTDDVPEGTGSLVSGQQTNDTQPTLSGSGTPGDTITVFDGDDALGTTLVDINGNWSFTPQTPLGVGGHSFTLTATDPAGNASAPSAPFTLDVQTAVPDTPVLLSVNDNVGADVGPLTSGDLTDDNLPTLTGTAPANTTITIYNDGVAIGTTRADDEGGWTFTPDSPLADGTYTLTLIATDTAGNISLPTGAFALTIDASAPVAPVITAVEDNVGPFTAPLASGGFTDDTVPLVRGTAEPGSTVTLYANDVDIGTAVVDGTGNWTFTPSTPLTEGSWVLTVSAADAAGNVSGLSAPFTLNVDLTAPDAPDDLTTPGDGTSVSGTAEAGATAIVSDGLGNILGRAVVGEDRTFTVPLTPAQTSGDPLTVVVQDAAGNISQPAIFPSSGSGLPSVPVITTITDDVGTLTGNLTNGQSTDDNQLSLSGTAQPDVLVTIIVDGAIVDTVEADASGAWSYDLPATLNDGPHTFAVNATNANGTGGTSSPVTIIVDTAAPDAPVIAQVTDDVEALTGTLLNGQITNDAQPTLSGTAEAGATVSIYDNGDLLDSVVADAQGNWSFTPAAALDDGTHDLTAIATDTAGNSGPASAPFTVVVDTLAPPLPVLTSVVDDAGTVTGQLATGQSTDDTTPTLNGTAEANATVLIFDNGSQIGSALVSNTGAWTFTPTTPLAAGPHSFTLSAVDTAGNTGQTTAPFAITITTTAPDVPLITTIADDAGTITGALTEGQFTDDNLPTLSGTGIAGATVHILDNGAEIGVALVDNNGAWDFTPETPLGDGAHSFTVTASDAAGNTSAASPAFTINVDTAPPLAPTIVSVVDATGPLTGALAVGQTTDETRPTLSGSAEAGATLQILDNGAEIGVVTVGDTGSWVFTPDEPLAEGPHDITVVATDAAGNSGLASAGFAFTVDTLAPVAPVIVSITDDVGSVTGTLTGGQSTDDTRPLLSGTSEANATVQIFDNGTAIGTAQANNNGEWTFTPAAALAGGSHAFTAAATDAAGNAGPASAPFTIVVDTVAPVAPVIALATDDIGSVTGPLTSGRTTDDTRPAFSGRGEPGSTLRLFDGGVEIGTVTVANNGNWSLTPATALASGTHTLTATVTDAAGNTSPLSSPFTLTVDITAPDAPAIVSITDDIAPVTGVIGNGSATNDARPTLSGTGEAGATLRILDNGAQIGTTTVAANGSWSFTPATLAQGSHNLTVTATDAAGNTGAASAVYTIVVDTVAPAAPQAAINADGSVISGTAEAGSTVTVTLPGNVQLTTTASDSDSGAWSITLTDRQTEGEAISVTARDAAGNVSAATALTAPVLPLSASDNVEELDLTTDATVTTESYSDYGILLGGALGNSATVIGNDTAQVTFNVAEGGSADLSIDSAATGIVLSLLNTQQIAVQRLDAASNAWVTVADSSQPQFADLLTLNGSSVNFNLNGLTGGTYRVLSYNSNLLATGSFTSLNVSVIQTSAGTLNGETTHVGNVIQDVDPVSGADSAPNGTVVSQVTSASGQTVNVGAGGASIDGQYGTLTINPDGSYSYTLTSTSPTVLGRTESFTYTLTHNGVSDSAQLVVALGAGTAGNAVTAVDNTATLNYETQVEAVDNGQSSQTSFSVVGIALGNVLNANILDNLTNPIIFDVEEGSTRTLTLQSSAGGVALLSTFDLYVYRFNDAIQQFEQYRVEPGWLQVPLLGGQSSQLTLTLPGGEYLFLLNNASGVTVLTGYTLNILQDHVYNVESVSAATDGNVLENDVAPAGTLVTEVNGVAVGAEGATIEGSYGTLFIDQDGNYSYTLRSGLGADSINAPDSFIYTVRTPDGGTDSASLNISATPLPVNAADDVSSLMTFNVVQDTAAFTDNTVGNANWTSSLFTRTSGTGSGTIEVAAGTAVKDAVLHFNVASGLALGGLTVNWTLYDGATAIRTGSFGGGALLGNNIAVNLSGLELHPGNYTLSYTGSIGALSVGSITITPSVTGTTYDLDNFETSGVHTVSGNIFDGSDAGGVLDQLSTVDTRLTITGYNGSSTTLDPFANSGASGTVQGHYGTLAINVDGSYTYTLTPGIATSSITTKETFNYTLNDQNGHTDNATLTIDMAPQFVSTAQSDAVIGTAYADTLIYQLLDTASATGGNGNDSWSNFSLAQGDKIDIGDLLVGWNGDQVALGSYLNVTTSGNNTVIAIDRDGGGSTYQSTNLVTLENVQTNLEELIQQNHIIT